MSIVATIRRETLWLLCGGLLGAALPVLVFIVGRRVFGPYAGGEAGDLVTRFFQALGQGDPVSWSIAAGPYAGLLLLRVIVGAFRG